MDQSRKVCTLEQLLHLRNQARQNGRAVVHCHGCFDIVHPGHIHYLQFARAQGDLLVVSVSSDPQVHKGIDRPLIPQDLRAASLAALECVDHVYVNPHPTAVELLEVLRPDVYVKGREYQSNSDPRFLAERNTVVKHGGKVVFSSGDVIYSSTTLINTIGGVDTFNEGKVRRYLDQYDLAPARLMDLVDSFQNKKMLVVGDYILDRYHFCEAASVASESPMMNLRQIKTEDYDGGAGVIALHLAGLGAAPTLITNLSEDEESATVANRLRGRGINISGLKSRKQLPLKHRYLADQSKLLKVDEGSFAALDLECEKRLGDEIIEQADGAAAVIFADFGYGLVGAALLDRIMPELRRRVPVITADVSGMRSSLLSYQNVDLLCPTEREVRETLRDFSSGINAVIWKLLSLTSAKQALITLGKQGLLVFDQHKARSADEAWERRLRSEYLPALSSQAVDPLGAGDALLATASLALAAGGSIHAAGYLGSIAAAIEVQCMGNQPVTAAGLLAAITRGGETINPWRLAS